jgi:zinc transporter 2
MRTLSCRFGEIAGGVIAKSLALLTDAAHLASDVISILVVLYTTHLSMRTAQASHTFGYHRAEVLGSLISVLILLLVTGILVYEAVERIISYSKGDLEAVDGRLMTLIAVGGIIINLFCLFVLGVHAGHSHDHDHEEDHNHSHHDHDQKEEGGKGSSHDHDHSHHDHDQKEEGGKGSSHDHDHSHHDHDQKEEGGKGSSHDHNHSHPATHLKSCSHGHSHGIGVQSIIIHIIGDCIQSLGVIIAGIIIWCQPRWSIADPVCTLLFGVLVCFTTFRIIRDIVDIIMERAPRNLDMPTLVSQIRQLKGVARIHDLHVWAIKPGVVMLSVHINAKKGFMPHDVIVEASKVARNAGINHITVQCHPFDDTCPCEPILLPNPKG